MNIDIPTHFRFKNEDEAKEWNRTTKDWIPISDIQTQGSDNSVEISTASFAWVYYDREKKNLEFKVKKFTKKDLKEFQSD